MTRLLGLVSNPTWDSDLAGAAWEEPSTVHGGEAGSPKVTQAGPGGARPMGRKWGDSTPTPSSCKLRVTLKAPSRDSGAPNLKSASRPRRPRGVVHVLHLRTLSRTGSLRHFSLFIPPGLSYPARWPPPPPASELHQARARPRPVWVPLTH